MAEFIESENINSLAGIAHGFFTRNGGVSTDELYSTLNCGYGSGDKTEHVAENRNRVAHALSKSTSALITPYQTHSADVVIATQSWLPNDAPKADAIVTKTKGLAIAILTADCTPVLFADEKAQIIGAAHAGWRGAIGGVLEATIDAMIDLGADRDNIRTAIGPCLHQPSYEVGPEFLHQFLETDPIYAQFFTKPDDQSRPHFDLPGFVMHRLERARLQQISQLETCTYENESKFFSYRRNTHQKHQDYGRQISAIVLT